MEGLKRKAEELNVEELNRKTEELKRKTDELLSIQREVEEQVNKAKEAGKEIHGQATKWLEEVNKISSNVKDRLVDETATSSWVKRIKRLFPHNNQSKSNSNQDVLEMITLVSDFVTQGKSVLIVCFPVDSIGIEHVWRPGFLNFNSRKSKFDEIIKGLKDEEVGLIGICGMGGIGKTKLVEEIGKNAKQREKLFDHVVIATVSQDY